jgi:hypothetical protein
MRRLSVMLCTAVCTIVLSGCSEPPQGEINRAQVAIDAARAAGAERYAPEALAAATSALQQSHESVEQRDYRLALSRAVDAYDRAQDAARLAADGKVKARADAETAINAVNVALQQLEMRLKAAEAAHVPPRDIAQARRTAKDAAATLQKARALLGEGNYLEAASSVKDLRAPIRTQIDAVEQATSARTARRPARRR